MRVLGFDFGTKRTGVASGQDITCTASPIEIIPTPELWQRIPKLVESWKPDALLVGHPLNLDDTKPKICILAETFATELAEVTGLPVHLVDERLSTKAVRSELIEMDHKRVSRKRVDALCACLIVESYLKG
jgi:putative Holliday junction resolvase